VCTPAGWNALSDTNNIAHLVATVNEMIIVINALAELNSVVLDVLE
jgi:hypothetical protein